MDDVIQKATFALTNRGAGGEAPCKKNDVILRRRPQAVLPPKDLVLAELFLGQRGTGTMKFDVNYRKTKDKELCMHLLK